MARHDRPTPKPKPFLSPVTAKNQMTPKSPKPVLVRVMKRRLGYDGREIQPGETFQITRIVRPDPDFYAEIHYTGGFAFPCGQDWFESHHPEVGDTMTMGADKHWIVTKSHE